MCCTQVALQPALSPMPARRVVAATPQQGPATPSPTGQTAPHAQEGPAKMVSVLQPGAHRSQTTECAAMASAVQLATVSTTQSRTHVQWRDEPASRAQLDGLRDIFLGAQQATTYKHWICACHACHVWLFLQCMKRQHCTDSPLTVCACITPPTGRVRCCKGQVCSGSRHHMQHEIRCATGACMEALCVLAASKAAS